LEGEARPTVGRQVNSSTNFGAKVGYNIKGFIPGVGYYYNHCNSDNPENNTLGAGISVKYLMPINDNGSFCLEGMYLNQSYQLTAGFHIQF
jgi:hypothetical protein